MIAPPKPDLITVNIDGREIAVPKGTNMIEAARRLGIEVPHFCYHPKLSVAGNCRMCLVEMGLPALDPATKQPLVGSGHGPAEDQLGARNPPSPASPTPRPACTSAPPRRW